MDEPLDNNEELYQLYKDFIAALQRGDEMIDFTEDDLVDIYDFSRGLADDHVAFEVLIVGLRKFPHNNDFNQRLLFFFHDLNYDDIAYSLKHRLTDDSPLLPFLIPDFYEAYNRAFYDDIYSSLFSVIQPASLEDGEILFMIDRLVDINRTDFLNDYAERISALCQYPSTLYQELYRIEVERKRYFHAAHMAQKLTEIEPFNIDFWAQLAQIQSHNGQYDLALETIEYALAINPNSTLALSTKAYLLAQSDSDSSISIVEQLSAHESLDDKSRMNLVRTNFQLGRDKRAFDLLFHNWLFLSPAQRRDVFDAAFTYSQSPLPDDITDLLDEVYGENRSLDLRQWAMACYSEQKYVGVVALSNLLRYLPLTEDIILAICESHYRLGLYSDLIIFTKINTTDSQPIAASSPSAALAFILACMETPNFDAESARQIVSQSITIIGDLILKSQIPVATKLIYQSLLQHFKQLQRCLDGDISVCPTDYNPFI